MALKPTIYKFSISVSDLDRNHYESLNLTVAQHPSETSERMMARVLAFCLNSNEHLIFTAGLSTPEEPDMWSRSLDDQIVLWVDVGEPDSDRIKKASRRTKAISVYSFNSKSDVWWRQSKSKFSSFTVNVYQFPWEKIQALAALTQRSMEFTVTISGESIYVAAPLGEVEVPCIVLQQSD